MVDSMILPTDHQARLTPLLLEAMHTKSIFLLRTESMIAAARSFLYRYIFATGMVFFNGGRSGASASRENIFDNFGKSRRHSGFLSEAGSITCSMYSLLLNACANVTAYGMTEFDESERSLGISIFSNILPVLLLSVGRLSNVEAAHAESNDFCGATKTKLLQSKRVPQRGFDPVHRQCPNHAVNRHLDDCSEIVCHHDGIG